MKRREALLARVESLVQRRGPLAGDVAECLLGTQRRREPDPESATGCRSFDYARGQPNLHLLMMLKQVLVEHLGVAEGFETYRGVLGMPDDAALVPMRLGDQGVFAKRHGLEFVETALAGEAFTHEPPRVVGEGSRKAVDGVSRSQYVACVGDARVRGRSALIAAGENLLIDRQAGERDRLDDELEWDPVLFAASQDEAWFMPARGPTIEVREAFSLLGAHTDFFGHWLSEYLPKYLFALSAGRMPSVPVLIDASMPATHRQSLELFCPPGTEIIEIQAFDAVHVARLWIAPTLMYMPLHEKQNSRFYWGAIAAPAERFVQAVQKMTDRIDTHLPRPEMPVQRVFLARKSFRHRKLLNSGEIESLAREAGFDVVFPEDLTFAQQVTLVRHASSIIALEGSAIFLAYLAARGAQLCILSHPLTEALAEYNGLLKARGIEMTAVTGPIRRENLATPHDSDYEIDPEMFSEFLADWLAPA